MDTIDLLRELSAPVGITGCESDAVRRAGELLRPFGETAVTPLGSLLCTVKSPRGGAPHLLLDAHIDEVGLIVTHIEESGFLRVAGCGGIDRRGLAAAPVAVCAEGGAIDGVVCSVPPHLSAGMERKTQKIEEICIDIGTSSKEQAERRVRPGDRVFPHAAFRELLGGHVSGRAMDNRAGCAALLKALELLGGEAVEIGLTVALSSMEEAGGQGAATSVYAAAPTHAIVVDVSFGHTPDTPKEKCGVLGGGPMIGHAPLLDRAMSLRLQTIAEEEGIPFQTEVMGGKTSTNADHIVSSRAGVRTALLSIPQKYMHTPIETVLVQDAENTARLIASYIRALGREAR